MIGAEVCCRHSLTACPDVCQCEQPPDCPRCRDEAPWDAAFWADVTVAALRASRGALRADRGAS